MPKHSQIMKKKDTNIWNVLITINNVCLLKKILTIVYDFNNGTMLQIDDLLPSAGDRWYCKACLRSAADDPNQSFTPFVLIEES